MSGVIDDARSRSFVSHHSKNAIKFFLCSPLFFPKHDIPSKIKFIIIVRLSISELSKPHLSNNCCTVSLLI